MSNECVILCTETPSRNDHILCLRYHLWLVCVGFKTADTLPPRVTKWGLCPLPWHLSGLLYTEWRHKAAMRLRGWAIQDHVASEEHGVPRKNFKRPEAAVPAWPLPGPPAGPTPPVTFITVPDVGVKKPAGKWSSGSGRCSSWVPALLRCGPRVTWQRRVSL